MTHFKLAKEMERAREIYGPKSEGRIMNTSHIRDKTADTHPYGVKSPEGRDRGKAADRTRSYHQISED